MEKHPVRFTQTRELLAERIQLLESQLAPLRQALQQVDAAQTPAPVAATNPFPQPANRYSAASVAPLLDDYWQAAALKFLCINPSLEAAYWLMARLGDSLALSGLSFWAWDREARQAQRLNLWLAGTSMALAPGLDAWINQLKPAQINSLERDEPLALGSNPKLLSLGLNASLVLPCVQNGLLLGFWCLHTSDSRQWPAEDLLAMDQLLDCVFGIVAQQSELKLLLDRDRRYQYAMEATNDGLWDWNLGSDKIYFSRSYLRMLGYDYDDLPGKLHTLKTYFIHPDDADNLLQEIDVAVANRREALSLQYRMLHRDGHALWVYTKARFFEWNAQGFATRLVAINTDITQFIDTQEELIHAKTQADMASKTKSEFLARISHEIRTPMNAIIGVGYLMQDTSLDEQQQSYLTSINSAADSLLQIINQLLDFSKIETGRVILEHAHFDLEQVFEKISRLFEISALHRNVRISYDLDASVPRFLRGDASRLSQILNHLLSNAFQYSGTDQVLVQVARKAQLPGQLVLEFRVQDKGLGMTAEKLAYVRESLAKQNLQESGVNTSGLGICNHLVHLMHGHMSIDAAPDAGCTVSFSASFEPSRLGEKNLINQPRDLGNIRVLIVDDNNIARTIIASTARSLSLQVDEADQPLAAMDKIRQADNLGKPYHLVLLDYRMPGINGLQLTGMIKKDRSLSGKPLVFLISAYHRDEISSTDPNAILVDEFLSKPVSESRLFEAVSQVINREHLLQKISPVLPLGGEQLEVLKGARVLVAEDNLVNQQVICGILKKRQVIAQVANNGREALQAMHDASQPFDAILMDLEMPEMDGIEATRAIRALDAGQLIPIIAVTAQAMRGDRERCLAAGMDGYLSKPVNPELLYSTLADMLRARKSQSNQQA